MINAGMFTSNTPVWGTPTYFFDELDREFHFQLDVCAISENAKCERYFSPEIDGLSQEWTGVVWMNPPYGRGIGAWVKKAYESSLNGATVVCLLPSRTDTKWFHDYCTKGEIRFVKGRLKFDAKAETPNRNRNAPFPSMVVIFRGGGNESRIHSRAVPSEDDAGCTA